MDVAKVFFSYSHADEDLRDQLEKQLALLRRQGTIEVWHDRRIGPGQEFGREIDKNLDEADIVLLLVSADFLASDYCYEREMMHAIAMHEEGRAIVIPVILRACDWHGAPFGKLLAAPRDGRPVTLWPDRDQAFLEVTKAIRVALERLPSEKMSSASNIKPAMPNVLPVKGPRSSNLRLAKEFTQYDKDAFKRGAFEFIANFFENSLQELKERNSGIEVNFRRIDANRFTSVVYRNGDAVSRCTVFMGDGLLGGGIAYSATETTGNSSFNENLTVEADEMSLYLRSMGMAHMGRQRNEKLTFEGAAELYWDILIGPLQR